MTYQLAVDLIDHLQQYGKMWNYTTGAEIQKLYLFFAAHLSVAPIQLIKTHKSSLLPAIVNERFGDTLTHRRMKMKYASGYMATGCVVHKATYQEYCSKVGIEAAFTHCPYNGLQKHYSTDYASQTIKFVSAPWLKSFYVAQINKAKPL